MQPIVDDGFIIVPYEGDSQARVEIGLSALIGEEPRRWYAAYLDYHDGNRVAKVMVPEKEKGLDKPIPCNVYIRVNGGVMKAGTVSV